MTNITDKHSVFLKNYADFLRHDRAAMFVGAGLSVPSGLITWKELLRDFAQELGLNIDEESDLPAVAQFHVNKNNNNRGRLNEKIISAFVQQAHPSENHEIIASLPLRTVWTTNFDTLLEDAFKKAGKAVLTKHSNKDVLTNSPHEVAIYKMHGDVSTPADCVITKSNFEGYGKTHELFRHKLKSDLCMKSFLFLGFGFSDPNVEHTLSEVRQMVQENGPLHYCIHKRPNEDEPGQNSFSVARFNHKIEDLKRYNLQPLIIDDYSEITQILSELQKRCLLKTVFVSGSMRPLGDFEVRPEMTQQNFDNFCRLLGKRLVKANFNIVSGFGRGVGSNLILGAAEGLGRNDHQKMQVFPFPLKEELPSHVNYEINRKEHREYLIGRSGICIVLGGTRGDAADQPSGVAQEIQIARRMRKYIIPVGATGHLARQLHSEAIRDPGAFYGTKRVSSQMAVLGQSDATLDQLVDAVIEIIEILNMG